MAESQKYVILSRHKTLWCRHPSQIGCGGCKKSATASARMRP